MLLNAGQQIQSLHASQYTYILFGQPIVEVHISDYMEVWHCWQNTTRGEAAPQGSRF